VRHDRRWNLESQKAPAKAPSLAQAPGLRNTVVRGAAGVMALTEEQF